MSVEEMADFINRGLRNGMKLMGDDMLGYKFIGENSHLWNHQLKKRYAQIDMNFNYEWLTSIGVDVRSYERLTWMNN